MYVSSYYHPTALLSGIYVSSYYHPIYVSSCHGLISGSAWASAPRFPYRRRPLALQATWCMALCRASVMCGRLLRSQHTVRYICVRIAEGLRYICVRIAEGLRYICVLIAEGLIR